MNGRLAYLGANDLLPKHEDFCFENLRQVVRSYAYSLSEQDAPIG